MSETRRTMVGKPNYGYFVWRKDHYGRAQPARWHDDLTTGTGKMQHGEVKDLKDAMPGDLVGFYHLKPEEAQFTIEQLVEIYPEPK